MPQIETWSHLPAAVRAHLVERMHDRKINLDDLNQLRLTSPANSDRVILGKERNLSPRKTPMAKAAGMTCAITNPLEEDIRQAILAADVMMGHEKKSLPCRLEQNSIRPITRECHFAVAFVAVWWCR